MANASSANSPTASPQGGNPSAYNPALGYLNAESRRTLSSPKFGTAPDKVDLPKDTVIKRIALKLIAVFKVTYASGSPVLAQQGVFHSICSAIEVNIGGNRVVKYIDPHIQRLYNLLLSGQAPRRAYATSAGAPTTTRADTEWPLGEVSYPATTQFVLVNEMIEMNFENPWGYGGSRDVSELDIRDVSSAELRFYWKDIRNVQQFGGGVDVTYDDVSIQVIPQLIENRARPRPKNGDTQVDYIETSTVKTYTGPARSQQFDLQTGNFLMGLGIYVQNGDANETPSENLLRQMTLKVNSNTAIQGPLSMADLQDENKIRFGITDNLNSGEHQMQGFAHMNLLRNGDWNTSINTSRAGGTDSIKLEFDTPANSGTDPADYTNPLQVLVHTHEMKAFIYQR
jgi:hypothetical protein